MGNHPTCPNWWKMYLCIGENFTNFKIGYCGEMKTLHAWVMEFFGQKGVDYFKNSTTGEVVDYIHKYAGKRLQIMKKEI